MTSVATSARIGGVVHQKHRRAPDLSVEEAADQPIGEADPELFTLEELARRSGVSGRTIRYYQTKKLLPRTHKDPTDGRVSRYGEEHLERLRQIGELHDRGLTLPAIRELLDSGDAAAQVAAWLGLDASLRGSWGTESPKLLSDDELEAILDGTPAGTRGDLEDAALLRREGSSWLAPSPGLLTLTAGLVRDGIDIDLILKAGNILQHQLERASRELMTLFKDALNSGFGEGSDPGELLRPLRPIAGDAARLIFARELERAIEDLLSNPKRLPGR